MSAPRKPVFDERERTDGQPRRYEESSFAFLDRIAGPFWTHPRALIEAWSSHVVDDNEYQDIRSRLRSKDDAQHNSAFLELYIHETLLRTGHTVLIHPELPHTTRRPDFYAEKDGKGFYLEAISPGMSKKKDAANSRRNRLIDVVNRLHDPNFRLWLKRLTVGDSTPAAARLRTALQKWLKTLNPNDISSRYGELPIFRWVDGDWSAEFCAFPISERSRNESHSDQRAIAVDGHSPAHWVNDAATITKALETKHHEYGLLGTPFIVAIGLFIHDPDRWHSLNAFYGPEKATFSDDAIDVPTFRTGDGYFGVPGRWQNTHVSGALIINQLQPSQLGKTESTLWIHPGAVYPLPELGWPGNVVQFIDCIPITIPPKVDALDLFGLPAQWPPGDPWV